jgi:tetratricopeptide (TPR) repeat protein
VTPADDGAGLRRRRLAAAEYHFDAGDAERARRVLRETIAAAPPGAERAEMLYRLASTSWMNLIDGVRAPSEAALSEAGDDPAALCAIHNALSWVAFYLADLDGAGRHARASAAVESRVRDLVLRADALATVAFVEFLEGHPSAAQMAHGIALQEQAMEQVSWTEGSIYTTPGSIHGLELMWSGRLAEARAVFEQELALYEQHAMFALRQEVLCYLAELECRAGRWELAVRYGNESMDIIEESGQAATQSHVVLFNQAWPATLLGRVDDARAMATTGVRLADANDDRFNGAWHHAILGFLDLSLGDLVPAVVHLAAAARWVEQLGSVELGVIPCLPDLAETLVGLGRLEEASAVVDRLEASAIGRDRAWAAGTAARGRALLAAARGDLDGAALAAERSIGELERAGQPFELARSMLVLGRIRRRAKHKRLARGSGPGQGELHAARCSPLDGASRRRTGADRWPGARRRRADPDRASDRGAGRRWRHQQGGRRDTGRGGPDDRVGADPDLPEAGRPVPYGAGPEDPRSGLSKVPGFPRFEPARRRGKVVTGRDAPSPSAERPPSSGGLTMRRLSLSVLGAAVTATLIAVTPVAAAAPDTPRADQSVEIWCDTDVTNGDGTGPGSVTPHDATAEGGAEDDVLAKRVDARAIQPDKDPGGKDTATEEYNRHAGRVQGWFCAEVP